MTVFEHLALALRIRKVSAPEIRHRVEELAALLNIEHLLKRRPRGLSGGESQRVALGRALSFRPSLLLLDEPLSALDEETRDEIQLLLRTMQSTTGVTTLHVTHHRGEAEALADQLFVLGDGCVRQVLPP
jgi:ABC-type sugar transport system ATPase subunit